MHMALKVHRWTRADLARLPDDGNRYEVLDGKLFVTPLPSPEHQRIAFELMLRLEPYVSRHALGLLVGPGAVVFGDNELQPDVVVFPSRAPVRGSRWDQLPCPWLVVEILSPTTRRRDLSDKRKAYRELGIGDYWVIDPARRSATCWTSGSDKPLVTEDTIIWRPRPTLDELVIRLDDILPA